MPRSGESLTTKVNRLEETSASQAERVTRLEEKDKSQWNKLDETAHEIRIIGNATQEMLHRISQLPCREDALRIKNLEGRTEDHESRIKLIENFQNMQIGKMAVLTFLSVAATSILTAYLISVFTSS